MMPPTTTGTSPKPASRMRATTSVTSGRWPPERIDSPSTCTPSWRAQSTISAGLARHPIDLGTDIVEALRVVAHGTSDAGRRTILAECIAQREAPFACGHAGLGTPDRGRHDIAVLPCGAPEPVERLGDGLGIARRPPSPQPLDLLRLHLLGHSEDGVCGAGEWRRLSLEETVDADHDVLAALDRLDAPHVRFDE